MKKRAAKEKGRFAQRRPSSAQRQREGIRDLLYQFAASAKEFRCPQCKNNVILEVCGKGDKSFLRCPECRTEKHLGPLEIHKLREMLAREKREEFVRNQGPPKARPAEYMTETDWKELQEEWKKFERKS